VRDPAQIISNACALLVIASLGATAALWPSNPQALPAPPQGVELSLEAAAPEPPKEPEQPKVEPAAAPAPPEQPPAPPAPEPVVLPPPEPVVLPPEPPPVVAEKEPDPPKPEDPPKPVEMLQDEDGEKSKVLEPARQVVSEEIKERFQGCLRKFMVGFTAKEAKKAGDRGPVQVTLSYQDGKLLALDITQSSGSPLVDQRARTNTLSSDCGKVVKTGSVSITLHY
jgi:outer membrane biosynthesis protein TonB